MTTSEKELMKRLEETEQRLRELESAKNYQEFLFNSSIGVYRTTPKGEVLFANQALAGMMGFASVDEVMKLNVEEQGNEVGNYRHVFKEMMESNDRVSGFESAWRKKDGTLMYIREHAKTVRNEQGEILYYEGTIENITDKMKIEMLLKESLRRLARTFTEMVEALSEAMNVRDPYTADHQRRVADIAVAISGEIGYSEEFSHSIRTAALLHDIGKLYIPAEILARPGYLRKEEMELIKIHPGAGWNILKTVSFDQPIADIICQHHEKLDGSGYPRGLKGEEIMVEARILAVADIYEALSSHRPYRPAFGCEYALNEVEKLAGEGKLWSKAVDVLGVLHREGRLVLG